MLDQRQGLFLKQFRIFLWIITSSLCLMILFLIRLFSLTFQYGPSAITFKIIPFIGLLIWFFFLFFILKEWNDLKFLSFILRLNKEVIEVLNGERKQIHFRKNDPWIIKNIKHYISLSIEQNLELERHVILQKDLVKKALENNNIIEAKKHIETLNEKINHI